LEGESGVDDPYEEIINPEGNPGRLAYARVSTADQDPRLQIDALTAALSG
jgi:hypothetical protein